LVVASRAGPRDGGVAVGALDADAVSRRPRGVVSRRHLAPPTMFRMSRKCVVVVVVCAALSLNGCSSKSNPGPLNAMVSPAIPPTVQDIPNPLRGQYEDLLVPLFPQGDPAQQRYPAWPASSDASLRVSWRQLQSTDPRTLPPDAPDESKYDFSLIDDELNKL